MSFNFLTLGYDCSPAAADWLVWVSQFPHDYPLNHITQANIVGEGIFAEENNKCIHDKWIDYYDIVLGFFRSLWTAMLHSLL